MKNVVYGGANPLTNALGTLHADSNSHYEMAKHYLKFGIFMRNFCHVDASAY